MRVPPRGGWLPEPGTGSTRVVWSAAGGGPGTLHVVFEGGGDVLYARSADGGRSWTQPLASDDDPSGRQSLPNVRAAPDGRVDAAWWDDRAAGRVEGNDVFHVTSADGGGTWSRNVRITDRTVDRTIGSWPNADVKGPPGLASTLAAAVLAWDDTRNGDPHTQAQDLYTAAVRSRSPPRAHPFPATWPGESPAWPSG